MRLSLFALTLSLFLLACTQQNSEPVVETKSESQVINSKEQVLYQVSTIDALMQGVFDGHVSLAELGAKGNFGIGTINSLNGELILEDGEFYHIKSDGKAYPLTGDVLTPFASVVNFLPEDTISVGELDYDGLKLLLDSLMSSPNYFYAVRLDGEFKHVHTRSVHAQSKPYPTLSEVTEKQPEFNIAIKTGSLIGFYCPEFVEGVNVTGYHLHFIDEDKTQGGHLLDFKFNSGTLYLDRIDHFEMQLLNSEDFESGDFSIDRSEELKKVEG